MKTSPKMEEYFKKIEVGVNTAYDLATSARKMGLDPEDSVNIPLAKDMAERVTGLISSVEPRILETNVTERIKELEKEYFVDKDGNIVGKVNDTHCLVTARKL